MNKIVFTFAAILVVFNVVSGHPFRTFQATGVLDASCTACTFLMQSIKNQMDSGATQEQIINTVNSICERDPQLGEQCNNVLDVLNILPGVTPPEACAQLNMCNDGMI